MNSRAREAGALDRRLDRRRLALDLHERIHARVALDAHGGAAKLELRNLPLDLADHDVPERLEHSRERGGIIDGGGEFLTHLVPVGD